MSIAGFTRVIVGQLPSLGEAVSVFEEISTLELPPRERAPQWREWIGKQFSGLDSDVYGDAIFDGQIRSTKAGDLTLTELTANRHRVYKPADAAKRSEESLLKIVAPWEGFACVQQHGRSALVRPGQWTVYDTTSPYVITNPSRVHHLIVMLPRADLASHGLAIDDLLSRPLSASSVVAGQALRLMRETIRRVEPLDNESATTAATALTQCIHDALLELSDTVSGGTQRTVLRQRICSYVASHLGDPDLSAAVIAAELHCSKRHLHNAFGGGEDTLFRYILRQRLEACMNDLRPAPSAGAGNAKVTVTDVALKWGFNNLSHFSREFRSYAGVSPRAYCAQR